MATVELDLEAVFSSNASYQRPEHSLLLKRISSATRVKHGTAALKSAVNHPLYDHSAEDWDSIDLVVLKAAGGTTNVSLTDYGGTAITNIYMATGDLLIIGPVSAADISANAQGSNRSMFYMICGS